MITEWQPIMPDDKLKLKSRTIYEFLRGNLTTFLVVGRGVDKEADVNSLITDDDVVGYREYDCRPTILRTDEEVVALRAAQIRDSRQGKKP